MATGPNTSDQTYVSEKVLEYEHFLNEVLRKDLQNILEERDKIYGQISDYLQLKNVIENIKENKLDSIKTQVDLGCNFYVQAKVPDTSKIFVLVGFGFFVEMTLNEALTFIDKKEKHLTFKSEELTKNASKVKANIKMVIEGLREIQNIEAESKPEQRNIFD